ncbi:MAG: ribonuclease H [Bacteroidota bacterium]|nr:ribonuclease H [Bacteroidota bacterium]
MNNKENIFEIYTDGSCNTELKIGAWAAIILYGSEKIVLTAKEKNTTNNRMELLSVIDAIKFLKNKFEKIELIKIFSDSQYVVRICERKERLKNNNFLTKKGKDIRNVDLVKELIVIIESMNIDFIKVKAHQKKSDKKNYNRDVDMLSRKIVREEVSSSQ